MSRFDRTLQRIAIVANSFALVAVVMAAVFAAGIDEPAAATTWATLAAGNVFIFSRSYNEEDRR